MLRVPAYIWSVFGAYWIIFAPVISAPAISAISERPPRLERLRLTFLAVTFALLLWTAQVIPPIWLMIVELAWAGLGLYWVAPQNASQSGEYPFYRLLRLLVRRSCLHFSFGRKLAFPPWERVLCRIIARSWKQDLWRRLLDSRSLPGFASIYGDTGVTRL